MRSEENKIDSSTNFSVMTLFKSHVDNVAYSQNPHIGGLLKKTSTNRQLSICPLKHTQYSSDH